VLEVPLAYWANAALRATEAEGEPSISDGAIEHSTTLAPEMLVVAQGYDVRTAMPHLEDSRRLHFDGVPYADLYRDDACTP
jgi:hypothetical protein